MHRGVPQARPAILVPVSMNTLAHYTGSWCLTDLSVGTVSERN